MMNRDNLFGGRQPQAPGSRPPVTQQDPRQRQPPPGAYGQQQQQPPPPRGYGGGGDPRAPSGYNEKRASGGRSMQLRPAKSPDNNFTFGNLCAVSDQDILNTIDIDHSARHVPSHTSHSQVGPVY